MNIASDDTRAIASPLCQIAVLAILVCLALYGSAQAAENVTEARLDSATLLQEIDKQFIKLSDAKRNGDPFSLELSDHYSQYAALLTEAGAYEEANTAYQQALQIQRSNYGIAGAEQMPILEALFDNHLTTEKIESAETYVARALRIETENPDIQDRPSVTMQLRLGHYFLDKLQASSLESESSAVYLREAHNYFIAVIEQNKHRRFDQVDLPYGEVAMTNYWGNKIYRKPEFVYERDQSIPVTTEIKLNQIRGRVLNVPASIKVDAPVVDLQYNEYLNRSYPRATNTLKEYFHKAYAENNIEQALYASTGLGDFNFLVGRKQTADEYYAVAWKLADMLPEAHSLKIALTQPTRLPKFNYAYQPAKSQSGIATDETVITVPMQFDIDANGRLSNVSSVTEIEKRLLSKAKDELREMTFRPAMVEGQRMSAKDFIYPVVVRGN